MKDILNYCKMHDKKSSPESMTGKRGTRTSMTGNCRTRKCRTTVALKGKDDVLRVKVSSRKTPVCVILTMLVRSFL